MLVNCNTHFGPSVTCDDAKSILFGKLRRTLAKLDKSQLDISWRGQLFIEGSETTVFMVGATLRQKEHQRS